MKLSVESLTDALTDVQDAITGVSVLTADCVSSKQATKNMFRQLSDNAYKVPKFVALSPNPSLHALRHRILLCCPVRGDHPAHLRRQHSTPRLQLRHHGQLARAVSEPGTCNVRRSAITTCKIVMISIAIRFVMLPSKASRRPRACDSGESHRMIASFTDSNVSGCFPTPQQLRLASSSAPRTGEPVRDAGGQRTRGAQG